LINSKKNQKKFPHQELLKLVKRGERMLLH
jgi:hypothetical protein